MTDRSKTRVDLFALIIATLSFLVAGFTLLEEDLREADISMLVGPTIKAYPADVSPGMPRAFSTGFYVPITFLNEGARTGTILRASLAINRRDAEDTVFYLTWRGFSDIVDDNEHIRSREVAKSLAVPGHGATSRLAWFLWEVDQPARLQLRAGEYRLRTIAWTAHRTSPIVMDCGFSVTRAEEDTFTARIEGRGFNTIDIDLTSPNQPNALLTAQSLASRLTSPTVANPCTEISTR